MKRTLLASTLLIATVICSSAKEEPTSKLPTGAVTNAAVEQSKSSHILPMTIHPDGAVTDASIEHSASTMIVSMVIHPSMFENKSTREVILTPMIINGDSVMALPRVVVAGRTRYYQRKREDGPATPYTLLRAGDPQPYAYSVNLPRVDWMERGEMMMVSQLDGCCGYKIAQPAEEQLAMFDFRDKTLNPVYIYVKPAGEIRKSRNVVGKAYIDFPVGGTQILPDYRRNPEELSKISQTIKASTGNKDVTITSLTIKGFASPEGGYDLNERLAQGRTEALIRYVADHFSIHRSVLHAKWEAEDWQGLIDRLRSSNIADRDAIIAIASDTSLMPDAREAAIRSKYPAAYAEMLADIYPALRRSDYKIDYVVRNYTAVDEIAEVMTTAPQHLSLEELFIYAKSLDEQSPEFREVMEVAVRMFPSDPTANLNAAMTAIDHGEYALAEQYLAKADQQSPVTLYARGILLALRGRYAESRPYLTKSAEGGVTEATDLLNKISDWYLND